MTQHPIAVQTVVLASFGAWTTIRPEPAARPLAAEALLAPKRLDLRTFAFRHACTVGARDAP